MDASGGEEGKQDEGRKREGEGGFLPWLK